MTEVNAFDGFQSGLVFGFDVDSGSIGYAVRKGAKFEDVGVLICDSEGSDLSKRRALRRQRRTLRSRKNRRQWFARELVGLGLPKPDQPSHDPISLRLRALSGDCLKPEDLHAALAHLFKRRGYAKVPWANLEKPARESANAGNDEEEGGIKRAVEGIRQEMDERKCQFPCQLLDARRKEVGQSPLKEWGRTIHWPRELLQKEFEAILQAQSKSFPRLAEKAEWLLYGDTKEIKGCHIFFKYTEARNPGILGVRWPRFDNRRPALDSLQPVDENGRPLHVVRKNKEAFAKAQWELALMHFRVLDVNTGQTFDPRLCFPSFIENLRNEWNKNGKITAARLKKLAKSFEDKFVLIKGQKPLNPESGAGRARFASPTLELIRSEIAHGRRVDPPQPILRRKSETTEQASNRYLVEIKHPLVRHRLVLFRRLLDRLVSRFGRPDVIVLEAVRSLALGQRANYELNKRNEAFRKERQNARDELASNAESTSQKAIERYRLWQEAKGRCPFCLQSIERTDLGHGADIAHLVPRAIVDCNEFYNLTVAHIKCTRELKRERTPFVAFSGTSQWANVKDQAKRTFSGRKLEIFLSPNAEQLIEQKSDLLHSAYLARVLRHISFIQLGWLNNEGRDPTPEKQNSAWCFQVTNGQLTSRLRKAWGLNQILHPLPPGRKWEDLSETEQNQLTEKNRGDLRQHALDAMVIACTLPWLAHRTFGAMDALGRHGWWTQDEKHRSKAANPLFPNEGQMRDAVRAKIENLIVRHHVSRSNHQQAYATTLYAKKAKDTYVAREVFTALTPKNLGSIWPKELACYCEAAWRRFTEDALDIEAELKKSKGLIPERFIRKLCFSHFQKWRQDGCLGFYWPAKIKIPIRNVRLISVKHEAAAVPFSPGTRAFVKRTAFKEIQVFLAEDQKSFVPVFVPYWKGDKLVAETPISRGAKPVVVIRRGMVVETKKAFSTGQPAGKYRVLATRQNQLRLLPHHVANNEEAIRSFGFGKTGLQPSWTDFVHALGYELPHPPSIKP